MSRFRNRGGKGEAGSSYYGSDASDRPSRTLFYAQPYRIHKPADPAPTFVPKTWKIDGWYNTKGVNEQWRNPFLHPRPFITYDNPKRPFLKRSITPPWPKTYKARGNRGIKPPEGMPSRKYRWESRITHEVNKKPARVTHKMITSEKPRDPWGRKMTEDEKSRWRDDARLHEILDDVKEDIAAKTTQEARKRQAELLRRSKSKEEAMGGGGGGKLKKNHRLMAGVGRCETYLGSQHRVEYALPVDSRGPGVASPTSSRSEVRMEARESRGSRGGSGDVRGKGSVRGSGSGGGYKAADYPPGTMLKLTPKLSANEDQQRKMHNLRKGRPAEEKLYLPIDEQRHFTEKPTRKRLAVGERKFRDLPKPLKKHIQTSLLDKSSEMSILRRQEEEREEKARLREERRNRKPPDPQTIERLAKPKWMAKKHVYQGYLPPVLTRMEKKIHPSQVAGLATKPPGGAKSGGNVQNKEKTKLPPVVRKKEAHLTGKRSARSARRKEPPPTFSTMDAEVKARENEADRAMARARPRQANRNASPTFDALTNAEVEADAFLDELSASVVAKALHVDDKDAGNWNNHSLTSPEADSLTSLVVFVEGEEGGGGGGRAGGGGGGARGGKVCLPPIGQIKEKTPSGDVNKRRQRSSIRSRPKGDVESAPRLVVPRVAALRHGSRARPTDSTR